jgi:hypothetical protein
MLPTYRVLTPEVCALRSSVGVYRDRTGDLRLAKLNQAVSPVSVSFRRFPQSAC